MLDRLKALAFSLALTAPFAAHAAPVVGFACGDIASDATDLTLDLDPNLTATTDLRIKVGLSSEADASQRLLLTGDGHLAIGVANDAFETSNSASTLTIKRWDDAYAWMRIVDGGNSSLAIENRGDVSYFRSEGGSNGSFRFMVNGANAHYAVSPSNESGGDVSRLKLDIGFDYVNTYGKWYMRNDTGENTFLWMSNNHDANTSGWSNAGILLRHASDTAGTGSGLMFTTDATEIFSVGAKITHSRSGDSSQGHLDFWTSGAGVADTDSTSRRMRVWDDGGVTVGTPSTSPGATNLEVAGTITSGGDTVPTTSALTTWTPTLYGASGGTFTHTAQTGHYYRIGNVVYFWATLSWSARSCAGQQLRLNLPTTPDVTVPRATYTLGFQTGITPSAAGENIFASSVGGENWMVFMTTDLGTTLNCDDADVNPSGELQISGFYYDAP